LRPNEILLPLRFNIDQHFGVTRTDICPLIAKNADSSYSKSILLFHVQSVPKTLHGLRNEIQF